MGSLLKAINTEPFLFLIGYTLSLVAAWGAGYLRGYRRGEEDEIDRKYVGAAAIERRNQKLVERIDFLTAENDAWLRQNRELRAKIENSPNRLNSAPGEPPRPSNHKGIG